MNVYTDPTQLNVRAAMENLPNLALPSSNAEADSPNSVPDGSSIPAENNMPPNMPPELCREGNTTAHCCETGSEASGEKTDTKEEKPRENVVLPELSTVGLTGFEPATSTPPV